MEASDCSRTVAHMSNSMVWAVGQNIHVLKPRTCRSSALWPDEFSGTVLDLILDPRHMSLPAAALAPLVARSEYEPGVDMAAIPDQCTGYKSLLCGRMVSSYPLWPDGQRQGDPICDFYRIHYHPLRTVVALADGCNWGIGPRDAAHHAVNNLIEYLTATHRKATTIRELGFLLMRGFSVAHSAIVSSMQDNPTVSPGTTTLVGGFAVRLTQPLDPVQQPGCLWAFVYASIGDCRVFRWDAQNKQVQALGGHHQRAMVTDAKDPGGRLGPHNGHFADTRNFDICAIPVASGDILCLSSDGVTDNLDPQNLGLSPADLRPDKYMPSQDWGTLPLAEAQALIDQHICASAKKLAEERAGDLPVTPDIMVNALIDHALQVTDSSRQFMLDHPNLPLPKDYRAFPGKMDHTTIIAFRLP